MERISVDGYIITFKALIPQSTETEQTHVDILKKLGVNFSIEDASDVNYMYGSECKNPFSKINTS